MNRVSPPMTGDEYYQETKNVSILDILLVMVRHWRLIGLLTGIAVALSLVSAVTKPAVYTSTAKMLRETPPSAGASASGGLALLRGFGINLGGTSSGLTVETYPEILLSREVSLSVVRDEYYFSDLDRSMTLTDYLVESKTFLSKVVDAIRSYTINLPRTLMRRKYRRVEMGNADRNSESSLLLYTEDEKNAIEALWRMTDVNVKPKTGIMEVAVTSKDPLLSATLVNGLLHHMNKRIEAISSQKKWEDMEFIRKRFMQVQDELKAQEEELAEFLDRNRNPETARLRTQMERIQRQVQFKTQLYSELQTQLATAEIEFQRNRPVVTLIGEPEVPLDPSGPRRKIMVIVGLMLGLGSGMAIAYAKEFYRQLMTSDENKSKMNEVLTAFSRKVPRHGKDSSKSQL